MKIETAELYKNQWTALDSSTYDGAPDAGAMATIGVGRTERDAIEHLIEQMEDGRPWQQKEAGEWRQNERLLAATYLREEAERLIRTIETSHKKAVRELPIAPLLAAVERAKGLG